MTPPSQRWVNREDMYEISTYSVDRISGRPAHGSVNKASSKEVNSSTAGDIGPDRSVNGTAQTGQ